MSSTFKAGVNPFEVTDTLFSKKDKSITDNANDNNSDSQSTLLISKLKPFSKHPFKPYTGDKLQALSDSIKDNGLYCPILVRPIEDKDYEYEIVAGHNRVQASKLAGFEEIPCIAKEMTDDEATIAMADTNLQQRDEMLPSEKAFAYKYKLDAMKSQGKRTDLTCAQVGHKLEGKKSIEKLSEDSTDSRNQIKRFIRLTYLINPLLDAVDTGKLKFIPAVNLSYLKVDEQKDLLDILNREESINVSKVQSERLKEMSKTKTLKYDVIDKLITDKVSNTVSSFKVSYKKVQNFFPKTITPKEFEKTIIKALEAWFENEPEPCSYNEFDR